MNSSATGKKRGGMILVMGAAILLYLMAGNFLRNSVEGSVTATPFTAAANRRLFTPLQGATIPGGSRWSLTSLRGKIVLLNYAATWCEPCRRETPDLVLVANRYRSNGVYIIGLMMDEGTSRTVSAAVTQYKQQYDIPYMLVRPDDDPLLKVSGLGLPTSLLLDRRGQLVRTYIGPVSAKQLSADIERLITE